MTQIIVDVEVLGSNAQLQLERVGAELEREFQAGLKRVVYAAYGEITRLAAERLKSTRQDYIKALREPEEISENTYLIQLADDEESGHGLPATWIEKGFARFDMKPGLLKGPRAKQGKSGRYNTVPFSHHPEGTPTTMGQAILQQGLKAIIRERNLSKIVRDATGRPKQGPVARVRTGQQFRQISAKTRNILGSHAKRLDGLVKYQKTYETATQSQYLTFRRVSDNSDPNSWIHPGYEGAHIFPTVELYVKKQISRLMEDLLR